MKKFQPYDDNEYLWKNIRVENQDDKIDDEIKSSYKEPGHPIAFSSSRTIYNYYNKEIPLKRIRNILKSIESHSLHKEFHKGKQNISFARFKRYQFQIDLCFILELSEWNDGVKYLMTVIDCFTRYAFVRALRDKNSQTVLKAFQNIIDTLTQKPLTLVCDKGSEFVNKHFIAYCNREKIKLISPQSNLHAAYVERFNRTLQTIIYKFLTEHSTNRYIDHLEKIVESYNLRHHRMINMSPIEAEQNPHAELIINNLISKRENDMKKINPTLKIGELVRISKQKDKFSRGYNPRSQIEIFRIRKISEKKKIPLYYLSNYENNEEIEGGFYGFELAPVNIDIFRIDKVIAKRNNKGKKEVLVKWLGYDDKYNQWIPEEDIEDIL